MLLKRHGNRTTYTGGALEEATRVHRYIVRGNYRNMRKYCAEKFNRFIS